MINKIQHGNEKATKDFRKPWVVFVVLQYYTNLKRNTETATNVMEML